MSQKSKVSRRDFIKMAGLVAASGTLAACGVPATATEAPPVAATAPAVVKGGKVRIAVGGWAEQNIKDLLAVTEFTKNTGIDVEVEKPVSFAMSSNLMDMEFWRWRMLRKRFLDRLIIEENVF